MDFQASEKSREVLERVRAFMRTHIEPVERAHWDGIFAQHHGDDFARWKIPPVVEALKARARAEGLWNLFLPDEELGAGLTTLEYAPIAEQTGRTLLAPEIFNCSAPDTGNMEVLWRYGSKEQQRQWLTPLLAGELRSVFCMTEPDVASSDATNMEATATVEGGDIVIRGKKHWASGLGDPRARVAIVMARTPDAARGRHEQHSMVLVPLDTKGVRIVRMQSVMGEYDEPHGHGEVHFEDARVPVSSFIRGPGAGFEIAQGRLGPGRIHHCMRCIGAAEVALDLMIARGTSRTAFGRPLIELDGNRAKVAEARIAIDQARLLTLHAAWRLDALGPMGAMKDVAAIKVVAPRMLQNITDQAIQMHGGIGVSRDTPLSAFFSVARMLRLADGPDEVHLAMIAKLELKRHATGKQTGRT
ncbi:MAG: acyl-CoA dehydrogenase family protein [Polyangia bacterium]